MARHRGPVLVDTNVILGIAIAATARRHELTILTRNERHFAPLDVAVIDPFRALPPSA